MQDFKHLANQPQKQPLTLIDYIGAACFIIPMLLPFSRQAWALIIGI